MAKITESISLLFAGRQPESAEQLISSIRIRGTPVRARQMSDPSQLEELLLEERFHAVILMNPDETGLEAIHAALRQAGRTTPVVVISDQNEIERLKMYEAGAFAVVGRGMEELAAVLVLKAVEFYLCSRRLHRIRSNLLAVERQYLRVLEDSKDPVIYTRDGLCISANRVGLEYLQMDSQEDLEGRSLSDFLIPEQHELLRQWLEARELDAPSSGSDRRQMTLRTAIGKPFDAELMLTDATIDGEHCTVVRIEVPFEPSGLEKLCTVDPVTGLSNRQHLFRETEKALTGAAHSDRPFALIEIALDDFERLQTDLGSNGSDLLLTEAGQTIREYFRGSDTVAHLGEGVYGILIPSVQRAELEHRLGILIRAVADRGIDLGDGPVSVTLSCGAVLADDSAPAIEELLDHARTGVEDVRRNGGNGYSFQDPAPGMLARSEADRLWKNRIEDAIAHDRIRLLYQPIVNLHGSEFPRFSVFVRLTGPDGEVYEPGDFLAAAERTGIASDIDRWIVRTAAARLAEQIRTEPRTLFFVKLTRGSLIDGSVVLWLHEFLHQYRIPAANVVVEIKEATVVTNLQAASSTAKGLKAIQAQLCVDDFGNGLNPFHILRYVDADYIKLDGAFVRNLVHDPESREAVRLFTEGGHAKGKQIIVPMVEDAATLAVLYELGVNLVQGHFVHPPGDNLNLDFSQVL